MKFSTATANSTMVLLVGVAWLTRFTVVGYYLPGVNIHSFLEGDDVKLKVNKLTSTHTQMPLDFYRFPFCQPMGGVRMDNQNLGEFLAGDRIESSPYLLKMRTDMFCEQLCITNLGRGEDPNLNSNKVVKVIHKNYHNNWIVDNLSAASRMENDELVITRYWQGFPVGFVGKDDKAYIHNHVNIELFYHKPTDDRVYGRPTDYPQEYRIVRFLIEPFSIKHEWDDGTVLEQDYELTGNHDYYLPRVARINNPMSSCNPSIPYKERPHTSYEMIKESRKGGQLASGKVLFTYDVIWTEDYNTDWSHRWDVYLTMNGAVQPKVHIVSIFGSIAIILVLMGIFSCCVVRQLRDAVARFSDDHQGQNNDVENTTSLLPKAEINVGWIRVYSDVFRPPKLCPRLFAVACGTGAQILMAVLATILFGWLGFLNPARRGALSMGALLLYCVMGGVNGYVTSRLYTTFFGQACWQTIKMTALFFPGIVFGTYMLFQIIYWTNESTLVVPFPILLVLLLLWALHAALVYCGAMLGYRRGPVEFMRPPRDGSSLPTNPVPPQPWMVAAPTTLIASGLLSFIVFFIESYYILASFWQEYYYYEFGFLLIVFFLTLITSAAVCVLFIFFQLKRENHHWWWRAFGNAGSAAVWLFVYSMYYFHRLSWDTAFGGSFWGDGHNFTISLGTRFIYFFTMAVVCLGLFCMLGFVGVAASLWFHKVVFLTVKNKLGYELLSDNDDAGADATCTTANGKDKAVQMLDISESEMCGAEPLSGGNQDEAKEEKNKQPLESSAGSGGVQE